MKERLISIALLAPFSVAYGQSSVTLYGAIDNALVFNSNAGGKNQYYLSSGTSESNRWGLLGTEDLGGGLKVIFKIEGGFSSNSGVAGNDGAIFGRTADVGLSGRAGTVTIGRQYSPGFWYVWPVTANAWSFGGGGYSAHPGDVDNLDSFQWINNAVVYTTPTIAGFTGKAMYSFGGISGSTAEHRIMAIGGAYANGVVTLGVGYQVASQPNFSFYGTNPSASATGNNMFSTVNAGFASAGAQKIFTAGAACSFGNATIGAVYSNTRYTDLGETAVSGLSETEAGYRGTETFNIGELNFKYFVTPAFLLGAAWSYTQSSGVNSARYQQVELAGNYSLSKRTYVYGGALYQHASGINSLGSAAVAEIAGATPSSNNRQIFAILGFGHRF
ncbi:MULTISPECIES: porin [Paraburkholderia]|uniref:porin n=1 Tax=Paraburkholderia TaxID=1822464 RepID=UPI002AB2BBED|nr:MULTISPECIES: porin [Paraburkholderia]